MAEAIPELGILCIAIVALGLVLLAEALVRGLFGTVSGAIGWIPWVGKVITAPIDTIAQKLISLLGAAEAKIDSTIGQSWHKLADTVVTVAELLIALPILLYDVVKLLGRLVVSDVTHGEATRAARSAAADALAQARAGIDRVRATGDHALHGIDALAGRVGALEHATADVLQPEIAAARGAVHGLEGEVGRAWDVLKDHEVALGIGALTAATAVALSELEAGYIRCDANKLLGRAVCRTGPQGMGNLLGLFAAGALALDFKEYVKLMQGVTKVTTEGVSELLRV